MCKKKSSKCRNDLAEIHTFDRYCKCMIDVLLILIVAVMITEMFLKDSPLAALHLCSCGAHGCCVCASQFVRFVPSVSVSKRPEALE